MDQNIKVESVYYLTINYPLKILYGKFLTAFSIENDLKFFIDMNSLTEKERYQIFKKIINKIAVKIFSKDAILDGYVCTAICSPFDKRISKERYEKFLFRFKYVGMIEKELQIKFSIQERISINKICEHYILLENLARFNLQFMYKLLKNLEDKYKNILLEYFIVTLEPANAIIENVSCFNGVLEYCEKNKLNALNEKELRVIFSEKEIDYDNIFLTSLIFVGNKIYGGVNERESFYLRMTTQYHIDLPRLKKFADYSLRFFATVEKFNQKDLYNYINLFKNWLDT